MTVEEILERIDSHSKELSREYKTKLQDQYEELVKSSDLGVNSAMVVARHVSNSVRKFQEELDSLLSEWESELAHASKGDLKDLSVSAQDEVKTKFSSVFERAYHRLKRIFNIK